MNCPQCNTPATRAGTRLLRYLKPRTGIAYFAVFRCRKCTFQFHPWEPDTGYSPHTETGHPTWIKFLAVVK